MTDDRIRAGHADERILAKGRHPQGAGTGVDMGIEFVLAVRDPSGNCTSGITRTNMTGISDYVNYGVAHDGALA
ncbi:MAG: hypothetical protein IPP33_02465 [Flavobacteriales bacterium]|nr:hypothetical protein [Flavobacteriales bacterium]